MAPVLRAGLGTSKGELLRLAEDTVGTMSWHGRAFPKSADGNEDVPEALPAVDGLPPHLHPDWEERFPKAVACEELDAHDPEENNNLEDRGRTIGVERGPACGERERRV